MNLKEMRAAALKAANDIIDRAKAAERDLTDDEQTKVEEHFTEIKALDEKIAKAAKSADLMGRLAGLGGAEDTSGKGDDEVPANSLGEHFAKSVTADDLSRLKSISGHTLSVPEWQPAAKANTDSQSVPSSLAPWGTLYDQTVIRGFRRPVVSDLLGSGNIGSMNSVTYLVEGSVEGAFATVAEGGAKPQLHMTDPTTATDSLKKIAGFLKFTDEMAEDFPFWVSEINNRGLYLLALAEENQLLNGAGTGSTVKGLLNRSGIQTEAAASVTAAGDDNAAAIYRAMTAIQTSTGLAADGLIINPTDYQNLRLSRDGNGQYYGGGFFQGQYGNGGMAEQPPVWGLRTVVSAAVSAGTVVVGAFQAATTVYRKGGVRVESTNSHASDFTSNLVTSRIEERVALACRIPAAIDVVTLDDTAPA